MKAKKILIAIAMVFLVTTGALVATVSHVQGSREEANSESNLRFEWGMAEVETDIMKAEPFHRVEASYERIFSYGESPVEYLFRWETTLNGEHLYMEEITKEADEYQDVYEIETTHARLIPEFIPEGEYTTELTVYAVYEDGTESYINYDSDFVRYEGHNDRGKGREVNVDTEAILAQPFHKVEATYHDPYDLGLSPEKIVFCWKTRNDESFMYRDEIVKEVNERKEEYTISTVHSWVVPEFIPEGNYTTELRVYAVYENGREERVGYEVDQTYHEGYNERGEGRDVDVETEIILAEPFHRVEATFEEAFFMGEAPEEYVFEWETTHDDEYLYSEELTKEFDGSEEHEVSTSHSWVVPEHIPEGEYTTELTVYARFEDGTEEPLVSGSDSFYYEGYN